MPYPSKNPAVPPAKVVTFPFELIIRILLLVVSATYTLLEFTAIPCGYLNCALVPYPSINPRVPPAKVLTYTFELIIRIALLSLSATYTLLEFTAIPCGLLNCALVPYPSLDPIVPPAKVLTYTFELIIRILLLVVSATYILVESTAIPYGKLNLAFVPYPSINPKDALPAKVLTYPFELIIRIALLKVSAIYILPEFTAIPPGYLN